MLNYNSEDDRSLLSLINNTHKNLSTSAKDPSSEDASNQTPSIHLNFDQIIDKVRAEQYSDIEQLSEDIEAIINDIKGAFKVEEKEYQDANELYEFFLDVKQDFCYQENSAEDTIDTSSNAPETEQQFGNVESPLPQSVSNYDHEAKLDDLIQEINEAADADGRIISAMFQILPPKSKFKDYYEMITNPIDMKTIEGKHRNHEYRNLNDLEKDLLLMVRNAKTYNKPGSQIYKDANTLKKLIVGKKVDLEQKKLQPVKSSDRIKAKRTSSSKFNKSFEDSPNASLNHEDSLVEDGNESGLDDEDDPMYKLYEFVRSYKNANDVRLSDPFMRLPNRRYYPDYYDEIKRPTTLGKIQSKIKSNHYSNINEMLDELNIMFKNALKYNLSDSQIYRDALELQKHCFTKAKEYTDYVPVDDLSMSSAEDDDDEDEEEEEPQQQAKKTSSTSTYRSKKSVQSSTVANTSSYESKKYASSSTASKPPSEFDILLKRRFKQLFKCLLNYCDEDGRYPIDLFMEKPSRKDYPDYYVVIKEPIDMKTIDAKIKSDHYSCEDELLKDFKLMFDNCREYNEDGSQIYIDADNLEAALFGKITELDQGLNGKSKKQKINKFNRSAYENIRSLFDNVINYKDSTGRQLSKMFMKLPSKSDYPAYYEIIKKPIDLDKIGMKIKNGVYESLDDILSDLVLSFDNACKFNEPDSQIYKDSMTLQNFAIQNKLELVELGTDGIPDVKSLVQDLLTNLFTSVYGHIDEEGRCYSESLLEIIEHNSKLDPDLLSSSATLSTEELSTFDEIKKCLQKNRFRRLDRFQSDMFAIFEKVRKTCRTDSQAFEDSIEMQQFFIRLRNELCKNGERLQSPALNYTEADLNASVENLKQEKLPFEQDVDEKIDEKEQSQLINQPQATPSTNENSDQQQPTVQDLNEITFNDIQFKIGDYVYVEPKEKNLEPHIIHIQRIYKDENGEFNVYGCWFYRPNETFHLASKRFLEKEVFRSDNINSMLLAQVIGKCCVMFIKDYFKYRPKGFDEKDVFVCESKYFTKIKQFKKIKWNWNPYPNFELELREEELTMIRVASVFKNKTDRSSDDMEVDDEDSNSPVVLDVQRVNVKCDPPIGAKVQEGTVYYEQYVTPTISIKQDDYCYVKEEDEDKLNIYQIDDIFVDKDGNVYIQGPLVVKQTELDSSIKQLFYPQEVFLTTKVSTFTIDKIKSKCSVLNYKDYITKRPTEIAENDVYLCESKYCLQTKTLTKLPGGLSKRLPRDPNIVNDEYYGFRNLIQLLKKEVEVEKPSLLSTLKKNSNLNFDIAPSSPMSTSTILPSSETENEESNDIIISNFGNDSQQSLVSTPVAKKARVHRKIVTGYILFASEVRKAVCVANPDCTFGEISRIIGQEWKTLAINRKTEYERKAHKQNEIQKEKAKLLAEANALAAAELMMCSGSPTQDNLVYECRWDKCDFQCEEQQDLLDHFVKEPDGHIHRQYNSLKDRDSVVFQCLVKGCSRVKKGGM